MSNETRRILRGRRAQAVRPVLCAALGLLLLAAPGCRTTVTHEPEPPDVRPLFRVRAQIDYEGNPQFLPRTVEESPESALKARYRYQTRYDHSSNLHILNPLLLVGFRFVGVDVHGSGSLEIGPHEGSVELYEASCTVKMRRSAWIWGYPSESQLRDQALLAVRSMIEAEMVEDRSKLEALETRAASHPTRKE